MNKKEMTDLLENITEYYHLNNDNGGIEEYENDILWTIEAPRHTTIQVTLKDFKEMNRLDVLTELRDSLYWFDPEEEFEEIWSPGFEYTAFQFVELLKDDEAFFLKILDKINKEIRKNNVNRGIEED